MNTFTFMSKLFLKKTFLIFLLVAGTSINAQNYFSRSNFNYLDQYSISGGLLVNQANHDNYSYKPNNKAILLANISALRIKNFSLQIGIGFRQKSLIGYGNYHWLRIFNNPSPIPPSNYARSYNIDFSYLNADVSFKVLFLQKYKFQPFIVGGARYNKILAYSDSLEIYNKFQSFPFKKKDHYFNSFFGIGCNYTVNSNVSFHFLFERNNDVIPYKQVYFNPNSQAAQEEIRFLSHSFQVGIQYTLPQVEYKLKKPMETKTE